jgi:LasA protease
MQRFKLFSLSSLLVLVLVSACVRSFSSTPATPTDPYGNFVGTIVAQTLTAYPFGGTAPAATRPGPALPAQTPEDFIRGYFNAINSRNYTLTWSLLSERFQTSLSGSGQVGYQVYTDFWDSVSQATVSEVLSTCQGERCAVNVTMRLDYRNGQFDTSIYPYTLTYDPARSTWLFDLLPDILPTPAPVATASLSTAVPTSAVATPTERPAYDPGDLADYAAQTGDTLPALAAHFGTTAAEIRAANPQIPPDATTLQPGMALKIPFANPSAYGTQLQIMPDSRYVNGPLSSGFNTAAFISSRPGWLKGYHEEIGGGNPSAAQLIDIVATNFSISPRALLVLLEYQAGGLSQPEVPSSPYPLGHVDENAAGLYKQLVWAANILNAGYYGWRTGGLTQLVHPDYSTERPDPWQNAATVAFQYYFSFSSLGEYAHASGPDGLRGVSMRLFGDPWAANVAHIPAGLQQPGLVLPFPAGYAWNFTGGPHSAWGGAALRPWAALDFAPPVHGCDISSAPVVAMADGIVARSETGVVVLDLDGDGNERTGWNILYLHIASHAQARLGQKVKMGDPLGFPSCEGGMSTGTHVHIARKYNGEWIPVDSVLPFALEGWIAHTGEAFYKGTLTRGGQTVTASPYGDAASLIVAGK